MDVVKDNKRLKVGRVERMSDKRKDLVIAGHMSHRGHPL